VHSAHAIPADPHEIASNGHQNHENLMCMPKSRALNKENPIAAEQIRVSSLGLTWQSCDLRDALLASSCRSSPSGCTCNGNNSIVNGALNNLADYPKLCGKDAEHARLEAVDMVQAGPGACTGGALNDLGRCARVHRSAAVKHKDGPCDRPAKVLRVAHRRA
jgi:hypothetical protein